MGRCKHKDCKYRATWYACKDKDGPRCDYAEKTGRTRIGDIARMHGITRKTKENAALFDPANCPFYVDAAGGRRAAREKPEGPSLSGLPEAERQRRLELYERGMYADEMAGELGITVDGVRSWFRKEGLPLKKRETEPQYDWGLAMALYQQRKGDREIGDKLAVIRRPCTNGGSGTACEDGALRSSWNMREKLRTARKAANMTQQAVADKLGLTLRHYQKIEYAEINGSFEVWDALEDLLGIHQRILREISSNHLDQAKNQ